MDFCLKTLTAVSLLSLAVTPIWSATERVNGHDASASRVVIKLRAPASGALQQLRQLGDADDLRALNTAVGLYVLHSRSANVPILLSVLKNLPFVAYIEPDYILKTTTTPNDPGFPQQWSFLNSGAPGMDISATAAWNISTGSTASVIGVTDT